MEAILSSLITGVLALIGIIITNMASNHKIENQLITSQAVTDTKLENLTDEVRKHNNFASKIPLLEDRITRLENSVERLKDDLK